MDWTPTYAARQAERSQLAAAAKLLLEYGLTLTPEQLEALGWTEGQYEEFIRATTPAEQPTGYGSGTATAEETGTGVPAQLISSWVAALQGSDDPAGAYEAIRASEWFGRMTPEQESRLSAALREKGLL